MYQSYWGLQRSPFGTAPAAETLVESPPHAEALARFDFLYENGLPLGLLLGESGSGKSALLAALAARAGRRGALVAHLQAAGAGERQLASDFVLALEGVFLDDPTLLWRRTADRLAALALENLRAVLLIDDLDRAQPDAPLWIERLLALPAGSLTVVAAARPRSLGRLGARLLDLAALRIELAPWDEEEAAGYLQRRLSAAGRQQPTFDPAAVRRLVELSGGAPRKVNQLAELALLAGAGQGLRQISADTIDGVHDELAAGATR